MAKDDGAFLTIGELAQQLGVAQHILRYWETRFPQLKPLQRSGNRRYYRPRDVNIAQQINRLLNDEGFTVRGAQRVLASHKGDIAPASTDSPEPAALALIAATSAAPQGVSPTGDFPVAKSTDKIAPVPVAQSDLALLIARLTVIRQNLVDALDQN